MQIYLKERIGNPALFSGRKKEIDYFLHWIKKIERELSQSTALLSRRKTGKSAILERLYNLTFEQNGLVVPFYYEIKETSQSIFGFSKNFFLTFVYQYLAFKTRKIEYLSPSRQDTFEPALSMAREEKLDYLVEIIIAAQSLVKNKSVDALWDLAREAPRSVAANANEYVVQFIDEFQHINRYIYRDEACTSRATDLAGSYLHTAEHRNAPLLVTGSWVGWLMDDLIMQLPGRFKYEYLEDMPKDECVEMIFKYCTFEEIPITDEVAYLIARLTEGNPFYISSLIRSRYAHKDLTNEESMLKTLEFEIHDRRGGIRGTWMEYVYAALGQVNDLNAKKIVLYLCKHRDREVSRKELLEQLQLDMSDWELEKRLSALAYSDIIEYGRSNFYYRGVQDNIFDKVFRSQYADEIEEFDPQDITNEYRAMFAEAKKQYHQLSGEYNYFKGKFAEFLIINQLQYRAYKQNELYCGMMKNLPSDFRFGEYKSVWSYSAALQHRRDIQVDILAQAKHEGDYSLIGEVKNPEKTRFTVEEAHQFLEKAQAIMELEPLARVTLFVFSRAGFEVETLAFFEAQAIAWSEDSRWLERDTN